MSKGYIYASAKDFEKVMKQLKTLDRKVAERGDAVDKMLDKLRKALPHVNFED